MKIARTSVGPTSCPGCGASPVHVYISEDEAVTCVGCGIPKNTNYSFQIEEWKDELEKLISVVEQRTLERLIDKLTTSLEEMKRLGSRETGDALIAHNASITTLSWVKGNIETWLRQQD